MTRLHFDPADVAIGSLDELPVGDRALHVEVGFGKDVRVLREAERHPDEVFLGVEASRKKAASLCRKTARANLRNVFCYQGDVRPLLDELPPGRVRSFTILFPDPWPKRRHHKHRWIQAPAAKRVATALERGGTVIVATDHDGYLAQITGAFCAAGLALEHESREVPEGDRSLFAQRFERLNESVTYQRWRKGVQREGP